MPTAKKRVRTYDPVKIRAAVLTQLGHVREGVRTLGPQQFALPTRLGEWTVRDLLAHIALNTDVVSRLLDQPAQDVADEELDSQLAASYGIFSGAPKGWATIVFSPKAARWVADEHWHSKQQGRFLADGRYELKVPYSVSRELLMDVLHYGSDAEIVEPRSLREQAKSLLSLALSNYSDD